jgi:ComF family protein
LGAAAVAYVYPWSDLIKRFKYRGGSHLASSLAGLMLRSADIKTLLLAADIWIPVPLTTNKLLARGFNQASHLANALRRQLNAAAPAAIAALCRTRETRPQEGLDRAARVRNVANAFVVDRQDKRRITGRHVLLIDDVSTTGATLNAACKALHAQGVASINTVVFARTSAAGG